MTEMNMNKGILNHAAVFVLIVVLFVSYIQTATEFIPGKTMPVDIIYKV